MARDFRTLIGAPRPQANTRREFSVGIATALRILNLEVQRNAQRLNLLNPSQSRQRHNEPAVMQHNNSFLGRKGNVPELRVYALKKIFESFALLSLERTQVPNFANCVFSSYDYLVEFVLCHAALCFISEWPYSCLCRALSHSCPFCFRAAFFSESFLAFLSAARNASAARLSFSQRDMPSGYAVRRAENDSIFVRVTALR